MPQTAVEIEGEPKVTATGPFVADPASVQTGQSRGSIHVPTLVRGANHDNSPAFPGQKLDFRGYDRYDKIPTAKGHFSVVCPKTPAPGKPWLWRSLFWEGLKNSAISRGTLSLFRWASANPEKVDSIYVDNGVCNVLSWPAGKLVPGSGSKGSDAPESWEDFKRKFGYATDEEALKTKESPIDQLEPLAKAGEVKLMLRQYKVVKHFESMLRFNLKTQSPVSTLWKNLNWAIGCE